MRKQLLLAGGLLLVVAFVVAGAILGFGDKIAGNGQAGVAGLKWTKLQ